MNATWLLVLSGALFQSVCSTLICMACGIPLAHLLYRYEFPGRRLILASAPLFFIMPSRVAAACIQSLYGVSGFVGIIATHSFLNMPFVFFIITVAYRSLDYTLYFAARDLGASAWRGYKDVVIPYLMPTIVAAAALVEILCFSSHTIPRIFGCALYHTTPDIMLADAYQQHEYIASLFYALMRLCVILPISLAQRADNPSPAGAPAERRHLSLRSWRDVACAAFLLIMILSMYTPLVALCLKQINQPVFTFWYSIALGSYDHLLGCTIRQIVAMSLVIAFVSSCLSLCISFILCCAQRCIKVAALSCCISISTAIPFLLGGVGCGIVCLWIAQHANASGLLLAIGCHTAFNYPYAYRIIRARCSQYDQAWNLSAMSLGATEWQAFLTVELPFLIPALWRTWSITAGLSLVEVGAEGILAHKSIMTMPIAIRLYREHGMHDQVLGLSLITCFCVWLGAYCILEKE
ncbi:MAG: iron ABC transporter permease [Epsilonproteobacteria bacterium]|nr:iron ABC transporter permease [Campylobacterota bacterium]